MDGSFKILPGYLIAVWKGCRGRVLATADAAVPAASYKSVPLLKVGPTLLQASGCIILNGNVSIRANFWGTKPRPNPSPTLSPITLLPAAVTTDDDASGLGAFSILFKSKQSALFLCFPQTRNPARPHQEKKAVKAWCYEEIDESKARRAWCFDAAILGHSYVVVVRSCFPCLQHSHHCGQISKREQSYHTHHPLIIAASIVFCMLQLTRTETNTPFPSHTW